MAARSRSSSCANLESLRAPFIYREFRRIPAIYQMLADERGPVVVAEQPLYPRWAIFENAEYELASTAYWRPLMNGYSGYTPDSYSTMRRLWYFPEDGALAAMRGGGRDPASIPLRRGGCRGARQRRDSS